MNDPNRLMKWALVVLLVALALLTLYPPHRTLKGGIDLVGGTSLLFEIDASGLEPEEIREGGGLASRVMEVLKERVDPQGQLNLEWRPVGNTRLEIRMPRPPKESLERRAHKDAALEAIASRNLVRFDIEEALNASAEHRKEALNALVRSIPQRENLVTNLATTYDAYTAAQKNDDQAAIDSARDAYEKAMRELLATNFPVNRLTDVLTLGPGPRRMEELEKLRNEYPSFNALNAEEGAGNVISHAIETWDAWAQEKAELEDPSDLKRRIRGAGVLEFRILAARNPSSPMQIDDQRAGGNIQEWKNKLQQRGPRPSPADDFAWFPIAEPLKFARGADNFEQLDQIIEQPAGAIIARYAGRYYVLAYNNKRADKVMLRGTGDRRWQLRGAFAQRDFETGGNTVNFSLDPIGGRQFGALTGPNVDNQLCIMMDDEAISHATIDERITESCQIRGDFTQERIQDLVRTLNAGSLPARLKETPLAEKTIGPSLGQVNREKGVSAAIWGAVAVMIFVLIYYGISAGGVANLALAMTLLLLLSAMALLQATFTLPGIAGVILTVGMAIDANVLIFERVREERDRGVVFKKALNAGYDKALSTIVDANLTTLLICIILGWVGSEEVKGFAITLGIGIVTSMFSALFFTRLVFNSLISVGVLKDFSMRRLVGVPNVDWLGLRKKFWPISIVAFVLGAGLFVSMSATNKEAVYDIEFLGGTSVQIDLKPGIDKTDEDVTRIITGDGYDGQSASDWLAKAAERLQNATVEQGTSVRRFMVRDAEGFLASDQIATMLGTILDDDLERGGADTLDENTAIFDVKEAGVSVDAFKQKVVSAAEELAGASRRLRSARVQSVADLDAGEESGPSFEVVTIESNRTLVQTAILATMGDELVVQRPLQYAVVEDTELLNEPYFLVEAEDQYLRDVIGGDAAFDIRRYRGGTAIQVQMTDEQEPVSVAEVERRLRETALHMDTDQYRLRESSVFPLGTPTSGNLYKQFAIVAVDDTLLYGEVGEALWKDALARRQLEQVEAALGSEKSLSKVVQFAPQVADQARNAAVFAIILALAAIVAYLWLRFGTKEYGLAAIVALVHDVGITLGLVVVARFLHGTIVGDIFALDPFRVDLPMIAAVLTVIGYSLNDTIVVFDRIRENRGKIGRLTSDTINTSLNQTLSRTLLTSLTTFLAVAVLYIWGGAGVHGFSFALMIGVIVGTYSSVGVATPLLYKPQLLRNVVKVLAALAAIGVIFLTVPNGTAELILSGAVVVVCIIWIVRSLGGAGTMAGGRRPLPA